MPSATTFLRSEWVMAMIEEQMAASSGLEAISATKERSILMMSSGKRFS